MTEKDSLQILLYLLCRFSLFITGILQKEFRLSDSIFSNLKTSCPNSTGDLFLFLWENRSNWKRTVAHSSLLRTYLHLGSWPLASLLTMSASVSVLCMCVYVRWGGREGWSKGKREKEGEWEWTGKAIINLIICTVSQKWIKLIWYPVWICHVY